MSDDDDKKDGDYQVGFCKPPQATRYKPGQSGNRKGRPKGSKNFCTVLEKEMNTQIPVAENGKRKKITKQEVIAKQLVNKAVSGDTRVIPLLLNEVRQYEAQKVGTPVQAESAPRDQVVMDSIIARLISMSQPLTTESVLTNGVTTNDKGKGNDSNI